MYIPKVCKNKDCHNPCADDEDFCLLHLDHDKQEKYQKIVAPELISLDKILNDNFALYKFDGCNFSHKKFYSSIFTKAEFKNCIFDNCHFHLTIFNEARFENCSFKSIFSNYSLWTDSKFKNCDFSGSDIILTNLMGIEASDCDFSGSDLYLSTFTKATFKNVLFVDCNLKRTNFQNIVGLETLNFKFSNNSDAIFDGEN